MTENGSRNSENQQHQSPPLAVMRAFSEPPPNWHVRSLGSEAVTSRPYETALIIGRFQPFHLGHLYLVYKALAISDKIVIGIGSANVLDRENPLTALQRHKLIHNRLNDEGLSNKVSNIVHLKDFGKVDDNINIRKKTDLLWLRHAQSRIGKVDVVVGNNQWVNGIFGEAGYKVETVDEFDRDLLSGTNCRQILDEAGMLNYL